MAQYPCQRPLVIPLEPYCHKGLLAHLAIALAEQIAAEHGRKRERHQRRRHECRHKGDAQRDEHAALHATEEEQRRKAHDDDEGRVEDGHTHLARGFIDQLDDGHALGLGQLPVQPDVLVDILHIDYGVVDQRPDGYRQTAQGHGVDAYAEGVEHYHRHEKRQGDGDQRDDGGAHIGKEYHQDDDHKDGSLDE